MSGIAGIVRFDSRAVTAAELDQMLDLLRSRGPDSRRVHIAGMAGLGQRNLDTVQGAALERFPLVHPNQRWVLVFDGRIDNRRELIAALHLQGDAPGAIGDGQLILAAYEKWGSVCPEYLVGDFAFAVWDQLECTLFCARDHFGVKPIYYAANSRYFIFASTPEAILAIRADPPELNLPRIADFLMDLEGEDATSTFYAGIHRLAAGHVIIVTPANFRQRRYWELGSSQPGDFSTEQDYIEAFQAKLKEAVRCRLANPAATALSLSGGMDSSALYGVARYALGLPEPDLHILSFVSPQDQNNRESRYIQLLLDQGGIQASTISLSEASQQLDWLVGQLEHASEPFDWSMNIWRILYAQAYRNGMRVCLDGLDGDLLLANTGLVQWLWRQGKFRAALYETLLAEGRMAYQHHPWVLFYQSLRLAFMPDWLRRLRRKLSRHNRFSNAIQHSIINTAFAQAIHLEERLSLYRSYDPPPNPGSQLKAHRISLSHPNLQAALERYDRVASTYSIEPRHPLMDVRLVEFCLGLPWQLKTQHGWTKRIMRLAMQPLLPAEVVWRRDKDHLGWSLNALLLKSRADRFRQILDESRSDMDAYVDLQKMDRAWNDFIATGNDESAVLVWDAVALALWLRWRKDILQPARDIAQRVRIIETG